MNAEQVNREIAEKVRDRFLSELHYRVGICGHCGKRDCNGKIEWSVLPDSLDKVMVLQSIDAALAAAKDRI